jgi:hypothetical protein
MQRLGTAIGIAIIGSVFFGTLALPTRGRPTPADLASAFTHSATCALAVSAAFAVISFLLVFALPRRVGPGPGNARPEPDQAPPAKVSYPG